MDIPLVRQAVKMMDEKKDANGLPPHRQPHNSHENLKRPSSIFRVNFTDFQAMPAAEVNQIFKTQHILVTGIESSRAIHFDREGLKQLKDLYEPVPIQRG